VLECKCHRNHSVGWSVKTYWFFVCCILIMYQI